MPDGTQGASDSAPALRITGEERPWLIRTRVRTLSLVAALITLVLVGAMTWHVFGQPILASTSARTLFIAATSLVALPVLLLFLDRTDNLAQGPSLNLPLISLFLLLALTALAVADNQLHLGVLGTGNAPPTLEQISARVAFFAFLAVPAFIGFVLAVSVSRLWSWVEEDRALAAMTEYKPSAPYRIGFREDFRDEALLGFIFVFTLVPIAMMQAHDGEVFGKNLFSNADRRPFPEWFGFFGVELAKAVPIVDWAEIYGVRASETMIAMNGAASRHAVFLARVMVDLVLIAALLQAFGIATRNRQQKRLYNAIHIRRLDEFVERVELKRAMRATRTSTGGFDPKKMRADGLIDLTRPTSARFHVLIE